MSTVEHIENILSSGKKLPIFRLEKCGRHYRVVVGRKIVTHVSDEYPTKMQAQYVLDRLNKRYHGSSR